MKLLLAAFFAQVGIITYKAVSGGVKTPTTAPIPLPLPSHYTAAALIYGGLAVLPDSLGSVPGLVGWGLVVANLLGAPLTPVKKITPATVKPLGTTVGKSTGSAIGKAVG